MTRPPGADLDEPFREAWQRAWEISERDGGWTTAWRHKRGLLVLVLVLGVVALSVWRILSLVLA